MMSNSGAALSEPIAETSRGKVRGHRDGDALAFRGLRYAVAKRFMPPEPVPAWGGVQDCLAFGASAPQSNPNPPPGLPPIILAHLPRPANAGPPPALPESEDCLFLNVWTSGLRDGRKRPVMLWLHGGFFYTGSGSTVDGSALAARGDVVVVSVNHRLNAFGFTHLADHGGPEHSGNAGMMDIIAALQWVRENIEEFGGDPGRVMAFGTSGGGMKTSFLMTSPRAHGLIHRAGVQSGPGLRFMERDQAAMATDRLFHALEIKPGDVDSLRTLPVERLLTGYYAVAKEMRPARFTDLPCFAPVIDPVLLPRHPFSPDMAPQAGEVPLITGTNGQEMTFFMGNDSDGFSLDADSFIGRVESLVGADRAASLISAYEDAYPDATPSRRYIQLYTDYSITMPAMLLAERRAAAAAAPTWMYRLDYQSPAMDGKLGALHTLEGSLLFDQPAQGRALLGSGAAPEKLARQMSSAWVALAANGDPNSAATGLPQWPAYDRKDRATMLFDTHCTVENAPAQALLDALRPTLDV